MLATTRKTTNKQTRKNYQIITLDFSHTTHTYIHANNLSSFYLVNIYYYQQLLIFCLLFFLSFYRVGDDDDVHCCCATVDIDQIYLISLPCAGMTKMIAASQPTVWQRFVQFLIGGNYFIPPPTNLLLNSRVVDDHTDQSSIRTHSSKTFSQFRFYFHHHHYYYIIIFVVVVVCSRATNLCATIALFGFTGSPTIRAVYYSPWHF